jgi:hypothetical protein
MNRDSVCTLKEALEYQNDEVIYRFIGLYDMPFGEAERLFLETKKWIWIAAVASREDGLKLVIDSYLRFIDEMWHNFVLFTKDYSQYCQSKFGVFVHHNPTLHREKEAFRAQILSDPSLSAVIERRRHQYSYIYDKLGAETLELWYGVLCEKYTPQYLYSIRRP